MPRDGESAKVVTDRVLYDDGVLRIAATSNPPGLTISGEIDEDTYPALAQQLAELTGPADIHLRLAGLTYCDLAGLRAIIRLAGASRGGSARRVVLHEVAPQLTTVLAIVGWDSTPGLVVNQGPADHRQP
jgi:anti-anti-sigma factor